jgi:hypothetical protein
MLEQRLIYRGGGTYQTATRLDLELAERTFQAGEECAAKITHKRSVHQNNLFHAMCHYAHDNQRAGIILPTWQALKQYLLIRADHFDERRVHVGKLTMATAEAAGKALAIGLRARDGYVGVAYDPRTGEFVERTAKSVRFTATMSDEMAVLFDKVLHVICEEIVPGADPEEFIETVKASCKSGRQQMRTAA